MLHAIRLSALRTTDDSVTPRIVTLDSCFNTNPYVNAMGLGDIDRWPEIKRALDSPPPDPSPLAMANDSDGGLPDISQRNRAPMAGGATGLRYTQTIMPVGRMGGAGMRVSGRTEAGSYRGGRRRAAQQRSQSSSTDVRPPELAAQPLARAPSDDVFTRPGSAASEPPDLRGGVLSPALSEGPDTDGEGLKPPSLLGTIGYDPDGSSMGVAVSAMPSELGMTVGEDSLATEETGMVDEGSDVDEDEVVDEDGPAPPLVALGMGGPGVGHARRPSGQYRPPPRGHDYQPRPSTIHEEDRDRRSSTDTTGEPKLEFGRITIPPTIPGSVPTNSALTATLNQHVPHLVSTGAGAPPPESTGGANPFAALYASVAAPATVPSLKLELFFPHSDDPSEPLLVTVRKDATVEEVTGHGLWKYYEEGRTPALDEEDEAEMSTVAWGLRIVEDDGEVDEDFPRECARIQRASRPSWLIPS